MEKMKFCATIVLMAITSFVVTACTYNVSMAHTSGSATDTIDDNATNTPNVSPTVNIPLTPGSAIGLIK